MPADLPINKHTTTINYKAKNGQIKEFNVIQPLDPDQRRLTFNDIQMLARQISIQLNEDAL